MCGTKGSPLFVIFVVFKGTSQLIALTRIGAGSVVKMVTLEDSAVILGMEVLRLRPLLPIRRAPVCWTLVTWALGWLALYRRAPWPMFYLWRRSRF